MRFSTWILMAALAGAAPASGDAGPQRGPAQGVPPAGADRSLARPVFALPGRPPPAGLSRPVRVDDLRALETFLERVDVTETGAGLRDPGPGLPEIAAVARGAGGAAGAFAWVRDRVAHVPYAGTVRGAAGTLAAGAGNSLDQALLLTAMLEVVGVPARLARGRLDWEAAHALVGGDPSIPRDPGDPWPRWLETAADHWWVEARGEDGAWTTLDPSFPGAELGALYAAEGRVVDGPPEELVARVRLELGVGGGTVVSRLLPSSALVGDVVVIELVPTVAPGPTRPRGRPAGAVPLVVPGAALDAAALGPWKAHMRLPGQEVVVGPFLVEQPGDLELLITVEAPRVPPRRLRLGWGDRPDGRLVVAFGAGPVDPRHLAAVVRPLHGSLSRLAAREVEARERLRPPRDYWPGIEGLRREAEAAWAELERHGPGALAWSVLGVGDRLATARLPGRIVRPGLRVAAVRWQPASPAGPGRVAVFLDDPIVVGDLAAGTPPGRLQGAHGVLVSAVLSQVLHRLTGSPPRTAFDATLQTVGTGRELGRWGPGEELPSGWPGPLRAAVAGDLGPGHLVLASPAPAPGAVPGWWHLAPAGALEGKVLAPAGGVHGLVDLRGPADRGLPALLGSLSSLHQALGWLAGVTGPGAGGLDDVRTSACAAASVAATALAGSLPPGLPAPAVAGYCGSGLAAWRATSTQMAAVARAPRRSDSRFMRSSGAWWFMSGGP